MSVSDDDDDDDDDDTQRWASRHVAFQNKPRPLLQPLEQRLLRTTPIKRRPPQRRPHSTGVMSRPATAGAAASEVAVLAFVPSRGAWSERPEDIDERRPHTRGEAQERDFLSIGMASPPARSMDNSPWNSSTNAWRPGSSVPSNVRQPWQAGDAVAPAPPRRRRRRVTTRVALAPPRSVRNVAAPAPWGHHRMIGGLFPLRRSRAATAFRPGGRLVSIVRRGARVIPFRRVSCHKKLVAKAQECSAFARAYRSHKSSATAAHQKPDTSRPHRAAQVAQHPREEPLLRANSVGGRGTNSGVTAAAKAHKNGHLRASGQQ